MNGWTLQLRECLSEQLRKLHSAVEKAKLKGPDGYESNANVQLFAALSKLIYEVVPSHPTGTNPTVRLQTPKTPKA